MSCVHVIDDDEEIRKWTAYTLAAGGYPTRVYESAADFLQQLDPTTAGCVISDVRMPGLSGLELVRRLKAAGSAMPVIVFSGQADIELAVDAMKAGAVDFLEKPIRRETLLNAIKAALETAPKTPLVNAAAQASFSNLTVRQRDVLNGILAGKQNKVIARDLGISARTVEGYRAEIMTRTQAGSVSELVRMAVAAGL